MLSLSLGALCPKPATAWLGIMEIPAATAAVVPRKDLLETDFLDFSVIIIYSFYWISIFSNSKFFGKTFKYSDIKGRVKKNVSKIKQNQLK
jgi:hypothetical protein